MMSAAPRWVVHQALAERTPATYSARQAASEELGISPDMEDAAIAYRLLLEVTASLPGLAIQYVVRSEWHFAWNNASWLIGKALVHASAASSMACLSCTL